MDQGGLGRHQKKASRLRAWLAFLDETGLLMAPLLRRTWHPRGVTPVLHQRTRHHEKVSAIGALCVAPNREDVHLYFRLHPGANITSVFVVHFLRELQRQLDDPIVLIWDRFLAHRAKRVQHFLEGVPEIVPYFLPPYAPELNPVEYVWSYLKMNPFANVALIDLESLATDTRRHARRVQRKPDLLRSFLSHSPLSLCLR